MKRIKLLLAGLLPIVPGYIIDRFIIYIPISLTVLDLIALFLWGLLAYKLYSAGDRNIRNIIWLHIPALFALLLVIYQEVCLGYYYSNFIGHGTQRFYSPVISLAMKLTFSLWDSAGIWQSYVVGFILMIIAGFAGGLLKAKRINE